MTDMPPNDAAPHGLRKVCCHHLKKCGGTSLNAWLDTQFAFSDEPLQLLERRALARLPKDLQPHLRYRAIQQAQADTILSARGVSHTHLGFVGHAPAGTFRFTVLRDPRARLLSQVRDYRRLKEHHIAGTDKHAAQAIRDTQSMRLKPLLEKYSHASRPHADLFDNYMVRALAMNRIGQLGREVADSRKILPVALDVLAQDMDFVGILEKGQDNHAILAAALDWLPDGHVPKRNRTDEALIDPDEVEEAEALIATLTAQDAVVYQAGLDYFSKAKARYLPNEITEQALQRRFAAINQDAGRTVLGLDLMHPLTAKGHTGRDLKSDGRPFITVTENCTFTCYFQTLKDGPAQLEAHLGWQKSQAILEGLRIEIDGEDQIFAINAKAQSIGLVLPPKPKGYCEMQITLPKSDTNEKHRLRLFGATLAPAAEKKSASNLHFSSWRPWLQRLQGGGREKTGPT